MIKIKKTRGTRWMYVQALFVFFAFAAMAAASYVFMSRVVYEHLTREAKAALDVTFVDKTKLTEYVFNLNITADCYGVLMDSRLNILVHPNRAYLGKPFHEIYTGNKSILDDLRMGNDVSERRFKNYRGETSVLSVRRLENGWHFGIVTPEATYYRDIRLIALILAVIGMVMASVLSAVLIRLTIDRNKALEALSTTDELTKLNNRRSFMNYMDIVWAQNQRLKQPVSVVMVDVDYFKKYNDCLGHLEGDKALVAVAQCMKNQIRRDADFAARFGGEEFVCLLPYTEKDDALNFAKKLLQSIEDMKIPHPMSKHSKYITVSAGVASTVPDSSNSKSQLLDAADKALYMAKESGRNRVVGWSQ